MAAATFQDRERVVKTMVKAIGSHNPINSGRWDGGLVHQAVEKFTDLVLHVDPTNEAEVAEVERQRRNLATAINEAVERTIRIREELIGSRH